MQKAARSFISNSKRRSGVCMLPSVGASEVTGFAGSRNLRTDILRREMQSWGGAACLLGVGSSSQPELFLRSSAASLKRLRESSPFFTHHD